MPVQLLLKQNTRLDRLSVEILAGNVKPGMHLLFDAHDGEVVFRQQE